MGDDVYLVSVDGYAAARRTENIMGVYTSGKKKGQERVIGWEGVLLPKTLIEKEFFAPERRSIEEAQSILDETQNRLDEMTEEQTGDDGYLKDHLNDKDKVDAKSVATRIKELKKTGVCGEEYELLMLYGNLTSAVANQSKAIKVMNAELDDEVRRKYAALTDAQILELLVNRKWYYSIFAGVKALYVTASHNMANRIIELAERYEDDLPYLVDEAELLEAKVKAHLERMGFVW